METFPQYLTVKVHPNAGKDVLVGVAPGRFEAWVRAKPMQGDANEAVERLLSSALKIPRSQLKLIKGRAGRMKIFRMVT